MPIHEPAVPNSELLKNMSKHTITNQIKRERTFLMLAAGLLVALVLLYMYFVSTAIVHVVMRKEMDRDIRNLQTQIAALETTYINAQHAVSADIAALQGFTKTPDKIFLDRTPSTVVLRDPQ